LGSKVSQYKLVGASLCYGPYLLPIKFLVCYVVYTAYLLYLGPLVLSVEKKGIAQGVRESNASGLELAGFDSKNLTCNVSDMVIVEMKNWQTDRRVFSFAILQVGQYIYFLTNIGNTYVYVFALIWSINWILCLYITD